MIVEVAETIEANRKVVEGDQGSINLANRYVDGLKHIIGQ